MPRSLLNFILLFTGLYILVSPVQSQEATPEPLAWELIYRDGDQIMLLKILQDYSSVVEPLPGADSAFSGRLTLSPSGDYLIAIYANAPQPSPYCLNLYDLQRREWMYVSPINCGVTEALFTPDETQIVYAAQMQDTLAAELRLFTLDDQRHEVLYRLDNDENPIIVTTTGTPLYGRSIHSLGWSPTGTYLTFTSQIDIMGGGINYLRVMNFDTREQHYIFSAYYGSYDPIWSPTDNWFLITLQDQYVTSGTFPFTNHKGDLYLVNSSTGDQQRITFTPAVIEYNIQWIDDERFSYDLAFTETFELTTADAANIVPPDLDTIVQPEPAEPEDFGFGTARGLLSGDDYLQAFTTERRENDQQICNLIVDFADYRSLEPVFETPIDTIFCADYNVIIGWTPQQRYPGQG